MLKSTIFIAVRNSRQIVYKNKTHTNYSVSIEKVWREKGGGGKNDKDLSLNILKSTLREALVKAKKIANNQTLAGKK